MAGTKNFSEYREALHAANPPCIPFFGTLETNDCMPSLACWMTNIIELQACT